MTGWQKYRLGIMVFIFLFTSLTIANAEVVFQTTVSKLGMGNMDYGEGKSPEETVEVVLPGQWYSPSKKVFVNKLVTGNRNTLEQAFEADIAAMKSDNIEQILANWHPSEREELKRFLVDVDIRKGNNLWISRHPFLEIQGLVEYKGMRLFLVKNDHLVFTFKQHDNKWFRTNSLSGDDGFDLIFSAWKDGGKVFQKKLIKQASNK
jgi:hypothetical protein